MLTIELDGLLEERLKLAAARRRDEPSSLARQVLDQNLPSVENRPDASHQLEAIESFISGMSDWVSKNIPLDHCLDDDRESIYHGRDA